MSRKAAGYYYRPKTFLNGVSYEIKEQLCLQSELIKKFLFPKEEIFSWFIFYDDSHLCDGWYHCLGKL